MGVGAEGVLAKGCGVCAGKALMAAELHRALGIPVRFKPIRVSVEEGFLDFIRRRLEEDAYPGIASKEIAYCTLSAHCPHNGTISFFRYS